MAGRDPNQQSSSRHATDFSGCVRKLTRRDTRRVSHVNVATRDDPQNPRHQRRRRVTRRCLSLSSRHATGQQFQFFFVYRLDQFRAPSSTPRYVFLQFCTMSLISVFESVFCLESVLLGFCLFLILQVWTVPPIPNLHSGEFGSVYRTR